MFIIIKYFCFTLLVVREDSERPHSPRPGIM
nr:MAG TPA: hypothetical protein [Caudoviricetes sp.]